MKKYISALLVITCLLCSCSRNQLPSSNLIEPPQDSNSANASSSEGAFDTSEDAKAIVKALIPTGHIYGYSWKNPSEISPDDLIDFCAYNNLVGLPVHPPSDTIRGGAEYVNNSAPADEVERVIQLYFDVTADHLKKSERYQKKNNTYTMLCGWGGGWGHVAMSAKEVDKLIKIEVGKAVDLDPATDVLGILTVQKQEDNSIKYLSYELLEK